MAKKEQRKPRRRPRKMNGAYKKAKIPVALREQVWISRMGRKFEGKCCVDWCNNNITVFDFQSGHNIPESKGGKTTIDNLIPICSRCNLSMGNSYTIEQWCNTFSQKGSSGVVPVVPPPRRRFWCTS